MFTKKDVKRWKQFLSDMENINLSRAYKGKNTYGYLHGLNFIASVGASVWNTSNKQ